MPVTCLSLVNQKLAYARALLNLAQVQDSDDTAKSRLLQRALFDAVVVHLVCAYQHYLRELGESYRIKQLSLIKSEQDLIAVFSEQGKTSSEIDELLQLKADRTSWLARLFNSFEQQSALPHPSVQIAPASDENLISLVEINESSNEVAANLGDLAQWQQQFIALIQRQRETSAEY